MKRQLCKKSGQKDYIFIDLVVIWSGQQQDSRSCYVAQPFREDLPPSGRVSSTVCLYRMDWKEAVDWQDSTATAIQYLQWTKICYFGCTFPSCRRKPRRGNGYVCGLPEGKNVANPWTYALKKGSKSWGLQRLVVLPLLCKPQLCFLIRQQQTPRMPAHSTICTENREDTKARMLDHIPHSNYNGERKNREKDNTQNQVVRCQKHTFLCFKIPMVSALCNSACTWSLQSILIPGYSSDFAWEQSRSGCASRAS